MIRVKGVPFRSQFLNATGKADMPSPLAEFNDVLHLPGHADAVAADFVALLHERSWGRLLLSGHESDGVVGRALARVGGTQTEQRCQPSPFVDLRVLGDKPFESTVTGKSGTNLRRKPSRLTRRCWATSASGPRPTWTRPFASSTRCARTAPRALDRPRQEHLARRRRRRRLPQARDPRALMPTGGVDLLRVGSADKPVGYLYNFVVRGKVSMFQSGFDYDASSKRSPGLLTHALAIEHYRQRGLREYDFLSGDAQYKRTLCNGVRELMWTTIFRDRPWIRVLLAARRLRARLNRPSELREAA